MKKKIPTAEYRHSVSRFAPLKLRESNSTSGSIGALLRASASNNAIRQPKPMIKLPNTRGFPQPRLTDSRNPLTKPPKPTVARIAPTQSMLLVLALRLSGIRQIEIAITAAASWRLIKNTHHHEECVTSHPPSTGPIAVLIAENPDQMQIASPRLY